MNECNIKNCSMPKYILYNISNINFGEIMSLFFKVIITILIPIHVFAVGIFVSQVSGNDGNDGTESSPFKTISEAIIIAVSGDIIKVNSGTYRERLIFSKDNITLQGVDNDVYITGANSVTNWESVNATTYKSYQPKEVTQLFANSNPQVKAKFPNQKVSNNLFDFTTFAMNLTDTTITSTELTQPDGYWDGATVWMIVGGRWVAITGKVMSSKTGSLEIGYLSGNFEGDGIAYITNSKKALDNEGEWCWQNDTLYYITSKNISNLNIEAKVRETLMEIKDRDGIIVDNIKGYAGNVLLDQSNNCEIKNSEFKYLTEYHYIKKDEVSWYSSYARHQWTSISSYGLGIAVFGANNIIDNCDISWSAGDCVTLYGENNTLKNSIVHDADYMGTDAAPVALGGTENKILNNEIYNGGREVITALSAQTFTIKQNRLYKCGLLCWDVGVFYTFDTDAKGAEISYNWVSDAESGNPDASWGASGIYIDNNCVDYNIHHNVIWDTKGDGIRFNSPATNLRAYNNTVFNGEDMTTYKHPDYNNEEGGCKFYNNYLIDAKVLDKSFIENKNNISSTDDYLENKESQNFMPKSGSPLVGAAIAVDEAGVKAGEDIGAYNFGVTLWSVGPGSDEVVTVVNNMVTRNEEQLLIFPNPVEDIVNITSSLSGSIVIMDAQGVALMETKGNNFSKNISKLHKGVYFAVVKDGKIIKAVKPFYKR